jgi:demethylmenaquinone methyltransferase/2-methoxy-6-polyprenyl-1,4-benzoquinol methylase
MWRLFAGNGLRRTVPSMVVYSEMQNQSQRQSGARSYSRISSIYERMNQVFTGGQNLAVRLSQLEEMRAGQRVLYVGSGPSEDALEAARKGVRVTCLDLSASMIDKARQRFEKADLSGEFVCADIMEHNPDQPYDIVVANFFLNIFSRPVMEQVLLKLVSLVRPGGRFLVADFATPRGNILLRTRHRLFYTFVIIPHWLMGLVALHPIYVYSDYYPKLGLKLLGTRYFRLTILGPGPWIFQSTTAVKEDRASDSTHAVRNS